MISRRIQENFVPLKDGKLRRVAKTTIQKELGEAPKGREVPKLHQEEKYPQCSRQLDSSSSSSTIGSMSHLEMKMLRIKEKYREEKHPSDKRFRSSSQKNGTENIQVNQQTTKIAKANADMTYEIPRSKIMNGNAEPAVYHITSEHVNNYPKSLYDEGNIGHYAHRTKYKDNEIQMGSSETGKKLRSNISTESHKSGVDLNVILSNKSMVSFSKNTLGFDKCRTQSSTKYHSTTKPKMSTTSDIKLGQQKKAGPHSAAKIINMYNDTKRQASNIYITASKEENKVPPYDPYNSSPGPAMYDVPTFLGRSVPHKPVAGAAIIIGRNNSTVEATHSPGPCYSAVPLSIYKKKPPEYSICSKNTSNKNKTCSPGPGTYGPHDPYRSNCKKGISFGVRHSIFCKTIYTDDDRLT